MTIPFIEPHPPPFPHKKQREMLNRTPSKPEIPIYYMSGGDEPYKIWPQGANLGDLSGRSAGLGISKPLPQFQTFVSEFTNNLHVYPKCFPGERMNIFEIVLEMQQ